MANTEITDEARALAAAHAVPADHTTDTTAPRDCASDGHHECSSCKRVLSFSEDIRR